MWQLRLLDTCSQSDGHLGGTDRGSIREIQWSYQPTDSVHTRFNCDFRAWFHLVSILCLGLRAIPFGHLLKQIPRNQTSTLVRDYPDDMGHYNRRVSQERLPALERRHPRSINYGESGAARAVL